VSTPTVTKAADKTTSISFLRLSRGFNTNQGKDDENSKMEFHDDDDDDGNDRDKSVLGIFCVSLYYCFYFDFMRQYENVEKDYIIIFFLTDNRKRKIHDRSEDHTLVHKQYY
jgi:hypothetical protein